MTEAEVDAITERMIADGELTKVWDEERGDWQYQLTEKGWAAAKEQALQEARPAGHA